jgi:hypothetical protein
MLAYHSIVLDSRRQVQEQYDVRRERFPTREAETIVSLIMHVLWYQLRPLGYQFFHHNETKEAVPWKSRQDTDWTDLARRTRIVQMR